MAWPPTATVTADGVTAMWSRAAGLTVTVAVATTTVSSWAWPTVMVGVPARLSEYWKVAVDWPAGMTSWVTGEPDWEKLPTAEVVVSDRVCPPLGAGPGLPAGSTSSTVRVGVVPPALMDRLDTGGSKTTCRPYRYWSAPVTALVP